MNNYKPTYFTKNAIHNQLLNTIVGNHDLVCSCDEPLIHITNLIFQKAKPTNFSEKDKKEILKCLGDAAGDTAGKDDAPEDGFTDGDLAQLFENDTDSG